MIPLLKPYISPHSEISQELEKVFNSGYIAAGDTVKEFEAAFAKYIGNDPKNVVAVSSCTAALHLALLLSGASPGTRVISTPMTAEPTNLAILHAGADIVWADTRWDNGNISWNDARQKITKKTVAVVGVDYGGIPCFNEDTRSIPPDIAIIQDAAHSLGARWDGMKMGTRRLADFTTFSLQAVKSLTTGDGGVLVCNVPGDADMARELRWFGINREASRTEVDIKRVGYKYDMNNITAAMGLVQLRHIDEVIGRQIENGKWFAKNLCHGISAYVSPVADPSYWLYTLILEDSKERDRLSHELTKAGIGNGLCHRRNDLHTVFTRYKANLPGLDEFYSRMLHIPCGWWVGDGDREYIKETIDNVLA